MFLTSSNQFNIKLRNGYLRRIPHKVYWGRNADLPLCRPPPRNLCFGNIRAFLPLLCLSIWHFVLPWNVSESPGIGIGIWQVRGLYLLTTIINIAFLFLRRKRGLQIRLKLGFPFQCTSWCHSFLSYSWLAMPEAKHEIFLSQDNHKATDIIELQPKKKKKSEFVSLQFLITYKM